MCKSICIDQIISAFYAIDAYRPWCPAGYIRDGLQAQVPTKHRRETAKSCSALLLEDDQQVLGVDLAADGDGHFAGLDRLARIDVRKACATDPGSTSS